MLLSQISDGLGNECKQAGGSAFFKNESVTFMKARWNSLSETERRKRFGHKVGSKEPKKVIFYEKVKSN